MRYVCFLILVAVGSVALAADKTATVPAEAKSEQEMKPYTTQIRGTDVKFDMVPIPGGEFSLGSPKNELGHRPDEGPQRRVKIEPFWMGKHEVTWNEFDIWMLRLDMQGGKTSPYLKGTGTAVVDGITRPSKPYTDPTFGMGHDGCPVVGITQRAAKTYCEWLTAKTGHYYRLPTEAEWEYACRAGSSEPPTPLNDYAWFAADSSGKYQKVATKKTNAWGLFDMLGNVMEWTLDQYEPYKAGDQVDPWIKPTQPYPISVRGGSWNDPADAVTCTTRVASDASWKQQDPQLPKSIWYETDAQWLGFRLIRPAEVPSAEDMYRYWNNGVEHDEQ